VSIILFISGITACFAIPLRLSKWESTLGGESSAALTTTTREASAVETTATTTECAAATTHHAEEDLWVDAAHTASHAAHTATAEHVGHVDIVTIVVTGSLSGDLLVYGLGLC
jgi:hypothetical protein